MGNQKENAPLTRFKAGPISIAVWENTNKKDGKEYTFITVGSPQRTYKEGDEFKHP